MLNNMEVKVDISRVVSDVGSMTVKYPVKGDSSKSDSSPSNTGVEFSIDKIDAPQKQVAQIVRSAEEMVKQKNATESSQKDVQMPPKGLKIDEYV